MIFTRAKDIFEGGGELLKAEAELASQRLKRAVVSSAILLAVVFIAAVGIITTLTGVTILLANQFGVSVALMSVGGAVATSALIAWLVFIQNNNSAQEVAVGSIGTDEQSPRAEAAEAKEKMSQAVNSTDEENQSQESQEDTLFNLDELKKKAVDFAVKNPMAAGSIGLLALSVVGPGKTIKLISRGAAVVSMIGAVMDMLEDDSGDTPESDQQSPVGSPPNQESSQKRGYASTSSMNGIRDDSLQDHSRSK